MNNNLPNKEAVIPPPLASKLSDIPRDDLIKMLLESAWNTGGRDFGGKSGYSFEVDEETCYRDVEYRDAPLYPTPEEALIGWWERVWKETEKS